MYLAIGELVKKYESCDRTLEEYLRAVLTESEPYKECDTISLNQFYEMLAFAFTSEPASFDDKWRHDYDELQDDMEGYEGWYAVIVQQIVDLREMKEAGAWENELRYFGISSPRESYWFNFDPFTFIECGVEGSLGGWHAGDDTGRIYVSEPIDVLRDDGSVESVNPEDLPNPTFEIPALSWEQFKDFLLCGQHYE
ncbi:MAG: hypothetical protein PVH19_01270 [Planctomycetia bacterium]